MRLPIKQNFSTSFVIPSCLQSTSCLSSAHNIRGRKVHRPKSHEHHHNERSCNHVRLTLPNPNPNPTLVFLFSSSRPTFHIRFYSIPKPTSPIKQKFNTSDTCARIDPSSRLRRAIHLNDLTLVRRIAKGSSSCLRNGDQDDRNNSSLHLAARLGFVEIVVRFPPLLILNSHTRPLGFFGGDILIVRFGGFGRKQWETDGRCRYSLSKQAMRIKVFPRIQMVIRP